MALCTQLAVEDGCMVYLGARSVTKGTAAIEQIVSANPAAAGKIELLPLDVCDESSVRAAAASLKSKLGDTSLYGLVNNAGIGGAHGPTAAEIMNTNWDGPRRVVAAFLPLLHPTEGRVVHVGSGAGPGFVASLTAAEKPLFCTCPPSEEALDEFARAKMAQAAFAASSMMTGAYGLSKALLSAWTMLTAKQHPSITWACCSPGFINTALTAGFGASKSPEEGTVSIRKCLFQPLAGNGWYYGSDGLRSPYHYMRNPGEPEYDGTPP
ncbi:hypothetical protein AB1Y20_013584 [Prymnesium parvum]|uniref:Protochlorophyllide reductase n=1 Tax=Prymnesium parvum TaxID=97485 RepID=A0AB34IG08_PRYPA